MTETTSKTFNLRSWNQKMFHIFFLKNDYVLNIIHTLFFFLLLLVYMAWFQVCSTHKVKADDDLLQKEESRFQKGMKTDQLLHSETTERTTKCVSI